VAIVTFTTDFGFSDGYVGAMKGVVLSLAPDANLVDISHGIAAQDVVGGALALALAAPLFPPGTIHVAVVDPGVGGPRADIVVEAGGCFFVGPDNGLLSLAATAPRRIHRIDAALFRREPVSPTFHGRDVFAPTAGRLAAGLPASAAGPALPDLVELEPPLLRQPAPGTASWPVPWIDGQLEGTVTHVDGFGNLLTSLPAAAVPPDAQVEIVVEVFGRRGTFRPARGTTFADVAIGALVAYVGSSGCLEIGLRDGSAAALIGASRGSAVRLRRGS
jgi:S-adenosyl-L-methionine hydrolase (adenosine-forming)